LLKSADPPTRDDVFAIALFTNGIFLTFAMYTMMWSTLQTFKAIGMCVEQIHNFSKGFIDVLKKR